MLCVGNVVTTTAAHTFWSQRIEIAGTEGKAVLLNNRIVEWDFAAGAPDREAVLAIDELSGFPRFPVNVGGASVPRAGQRRPAHRVGPQQVLPLRPGVVASHLGGVPDERGRYGPGHERILRGFVDCLLAGRPFPLDGREGRKVSDLLWAICQSTCVATKRVHQ